MVQGQNWAEKYDTELEQLLQRLKTEISNTVPPIPTGDNNCREIDDYICHLNTFYYQSFAHHFMPGYLQQVQQSIKESLALSRTQSMVKKDIMAIIRRYAGLYNKAKTLSNLLLTSRRDLETSKAIAEREQRIRQIKLKDSLEQLLNSLRGLHKLVKPALQLSHNSAYTDAMASSVLCREAARVWSTMDSNNLQMLKEADRIYQTIHLIVGLTADFCVTSSLKDVQDILKNINEMIRLLSIRTAVLQCWFDDSIRPYLTSSIELMDLYLQLGQFSKAVDAARGLQQWLDPLTTVLKQQQVLLTEGIQPSLPCLWQDIPPAKIDNLEKKLTDSEQNLIEFMSDLAASAPDTSESILEKLYKFLQNDYEFYQSLTLNRHAVFAGNWLDRICVNLFLIISGLESGHIQHNANLRLCGYYQDFLDWMDKYLILLDHIISDLERLLAPRNLTRIWKGIDIRIEHVELKAGNQFPPEYVHLLDQHQVETRISDHDMIILHAEGDLFIVRVDELAEEEMPYLIVSMKGQN